MQLNKIEYGFIMSLGRAINPKYSIAKEIAKRQSYLIEIKGRRKLVEAKLKRLAYRDPAFARLVLEELMGYGHVFPKVNKIVNKKRLAFTLS